MKFPKEPIEPKKPTKPRKPSEPKSPEAFILVDKNQYVGEVPSNCHHSFSKKELISLVEKMNEYDELRIDHEVSYGYGCCDSDYHEVTINVVKNEKIPNPRLQKEEQSYKKSLTAYKRKMTNYEKKLEQYNEDMKEYNKAFAEYEVEYAKCRLEMLKKEEEKLIKKINK